LEKPTDEALMQEVSQGNLDAMTLLFERYHKWIYNFFYQMVQDKGVSEDLVQNVFYKAIRYRGSYKGGKFASWIFQIARNISSDHFGKVKKKQIEVVVDQIPDRTDDQPVEATEQVERLRIVMDRLPVAEKELLVMSRFQGMKYKQIAEVIGSNETAVKTKIHRTIKKLKVLYFETI